MNSAFGAGRYARLRLACTPPARHSVPSSRGVSSQSSSARAPASAEHGNDEPVPLPLLPRPLGVSLQPSTTHAGWTESMWNQDTRMENRRVLSVVVVINRIIWLKQL